jgi:NodT family efflux transporter outer membrane factor (OMF) lipoprotein
MVYCAHESDECERAGDERRRRALSCLPMTVVRGSSASPLRRLGAWTGTAAHALPGPLVAVALLAVGGCAAPLHPPRLDARVPAHWQPIPVASGDAAARPAPLGRAPDFHVWWRFFGDTTLDHLVDRALRDNLDVAQVGYRLRAARELARAAGADDLPQLTLRTLDTPNPQSTAGFLQLGPQMSWELGLFGRSHSAQSVAAADVGLARADDLAARVSLVAEVARQYLMLRAAQQRLELGTALVDVQRRRCELILVRQHEQLASGSDAAQAQAALAEARAALSEPQAQIAQAQYRLAALLASDRPDAAWSTPAPMPSLHDFRLDQTPADLLRTRPEIQRAEQAVLRSAGARGLAWADLFPRLQLQGMLTYSLQENGAGAGSLHRVLSVGPGVDLPLFDWGQRQALLRARDDELSAAVLAYRQSVLEGVAEAQSALAQLEWTRQRLDQARLAVSVRAHAQSGAQAAVRLGLADGVELADAQAAWLETRLALNQAQEAHALAFVTLYKALGGAALPAQDSSS